MWSCGLRATLELSCERRNQGATMYLFIFADEIVRQHHAELIRTAEAGRTRRLARRGTSVRRSWNLTWHTVRKVPHWQFAH